MRSALALVLLAAACGRATPDDPGVPPDAAVDAPVADASVPRLVETAQLCKLLSNRNVSDPTANDVQHAANVLGADLGIPVVADDVLYLLFGDTIGVAGIWSPTESHPDAVGYGLDSATAIAAQPGLLCDRLGIVTLPAAQSLGPSIDPTIAADFAGAAMIAPPDHALAEYIRNPAGRAGEQTFPQLPGDFEVPSGAFSVGGAIYVLYTTVAGPGDVTMKASYLARWAQPTTSGPFAYQILYQVDERFDGAGPLHGHFINVAAAVHGDYLYLFGTGEYRKSAIHVARKLLAALDTPGGFEELGEIASTAGYGELSVRYFAELGRWMLLAEELTPTSNRIVAYFADAPRGPWGEPVVVHDMADPGFRSRYCCAVEDSCTSQQMFNCSRTGFYGTYLFPGVDDRPATFTVTYTMSSFSPYNVALFQAVFAK